MAYTTIDNPADYFNTILWTGNTSTTRSFTGVGFQPDWVWSKQRSTTRGHQLMDSVRGANKTLESHSTNAEGNQFSNGYLTSFDSDGFSATQGSSAFLNFNENSGTYVAWNWLAGGTASSNTDGSITSSVSANTTAGFSIVTYTGSGSNPATIGHGLNAVPQVMLLKKRTGSSALSWKVYHKEIGAGKYLILNSTDAEASDTTIWNNTTPSSSVFTVGSSDTNNTDDYVVYCFAEKKGYSKFGSYVASGDATDANFIYLGFKPSWVMFKKTSGADNWLILDNKRSSSSGKNLVDFHLRANLSNTESDLSGSDNGVDFLSNGIKLRKNNGEFNASGATYIYMCFAESPFVSSTGIPTTAR